MTRRPMALVAVLGLAAALAVAVPATATSRGQVQGADQLFPTTIPLPNGFAPEGIAIGILPFAFFGSRVTGDIYRANLVTGRGRVITENPGGPSLGMKVDRRGRLFVAGGPGGNARVVNAFSGDVIATYQFAAAPTFINDVILTPTAAWFTDSFNPFLYRLPLGRAGALPPQSAVVQVPLSGDYVHQPGPNVFNANGIARTPDGRGLLIVQSATGKLFRVDPATGVTDEVELTGGTLTAGDGLLLEGRTLFAVQNSLEQVAVVRLNDRGTSGTIVQVIPDDGRFVIPTTVASFGNRLYLPNAKFGTPVTPTTPYEAVAVDEP